MYKSGTANVMPSERTLTGRRAQDREPPRGSRYPVSNLENDGWAWLLGRMRYLLASAPKPDVAAHACRITGSKQPGA